MITATAMDDEIRWTAVLERDPGADGEFVYAVASTRVYCRPTCPSRRPNRRQVRFFRSPAEAEAGGYRACRRCTPREKEQAVMRLVREARSYLDHHLDETVTLVRLGQAVGMSPYHLQRTFKRLTGITPREYASGRRVDRMKSQLKKGQTVSGATYDAGFSSPSRAYDHSLRRLGMTPAAYRTGGRGIVIRYTVVDTSAGAVLVAATDRGVCAVTLGDAPAAFEAELRREYPAAQIERADGALAEWTAAVVGRVEGKDGAQVPLDLRGSAFQRRVWDALQRIPRGTTRTYGQIARELGQPTAARAVAGACASNKVALVIPCHRVIREDGGLGGYRWGIERKRELLKREKA
jgi:AraC family transcriptional regulator, regulatory protein of adaptative response / methylated-DNA-[protein]-cysteine methyltransferase